MIGFIGPTAARIANIVLVVVGVGLSSVATAAPVTLRLGYGVAAEEPLWLLLAKPELGPNYGKIYTLDATRFPASDKRAQAFVADAIDLASSSANSVIFAAAEGIPVKIIASLSRESAKAFSTTFYARAESGIKAAADLRGKTVGINGFSTSGELWLRAALKKAGLSENDVTIVPIGFSAMEQALESGKIDVGMFPQPFAALLEKNMKVTKVFDAKYGVPFDEELIVLTGKEEFLEKNAVAIRALLDDLKATTQYYLDKPEEARKILIDSKLVRVTPDVYLKMNDYYHQPDLTVDPEALANMQQFQMNAGFQKKSVDVKALVAPAYLSRP